MVVEHDEKLKIDWFSWKSVAWISGMRICPGIEVQKIHRTNSTMYTFHGIGKLLGRAVFEIRWTKEVYMIRVWLLCSFPSSNSLLANYLWKDLLVVRHSCITGRGVFTCISTINDRFQTHGTKTLNFNENPNKTKVNNTTTTTRILSLLDNTNDAPHNTAPRRSQGRDDRIPSPFYLFYCPTWLIKLTIFCSLQLPQQG